MMRHRREALGHRGDTKDRVAVDGIVRDQVAHAERARVGELAVQHDAGDQTRSRPPHASARAGARPASARSRRAWPCARARSIRGTNGAAWAEAPATRHRGATREPHPAVAAANHPDRHCKHGPHRRARQHRRHGCRSDGSCQGPGGVQVVFVACADGLITRERSARRIDQRAEAADVGDVLGLHRDRRAQPARARDRRVDVGDRDVGQPVRASRPSCNSGVTPARSTPSRPSTWYTSSGPMFIDLCE